MRSLSTNCINCAVILISLLAAFPICHGDETATAAPEVVPWLLIADPPKLERITELIPYTVNFTLAYTGAEEPKYATAESVFVVKISMTNSLTAVLSSNRIDFTWEDVVEGNNMTLTVTGQVIGYVDLIFVMDILPKNGSVAAETVTAFPPYLVTVIRASDTLDNIFTV